MNNFAEKLTELCAQIPNLTNQDLARKFGVIPATIFRWKYGLAIPLPGMQKIVLEYLEKLINEKANETT